MKIRANVIYLFQKVGRKMKLKKFKEKNPKRTSIIIFTLICILLVSGVMLYRTFAIFEVKTNQNVIKGTVQDPGDVYFAFYYDGSIQKDMPDKDEGYVLDEEKSYCGVTGTNDDNIKVTLTEDYQIRIDGVTTSRTKCNLYFTKGIFLLGHGVPVVTSGNGLYEVTHDDIDFEEEGWKNKEYRYAGVSPNNYLTFNDETWRIIGLVNVKINDTIEQRVKIIKEESIGNYVWDSSSQNINNGQGSNDWKNSKLNILLNNYYWNSLNNQQCYIGPNNQTASCNFTNGLKNVQSKIENVIWHTTILKNYYDAPNYYYMEKESTETYSKSCKVNCNDSLTRETTLKGTIGLIYPSDFAYSTTGGFSTNRETCLNTLIINWAPQYQNLPDCRNNNWMHLFMKYSGTINVMYFDDNPRIIGINNEGFISNPATDQFFNTYPVVYLKNTVKTISGTGNADNHFTVANIEP